MNHEKSHPNRRRFIKYLTATGLAAQSLFTSACASFTRAETPEEKVQSKKPSSAASEKMPMQKLGRTDLVSSRLVFGCGAALAGGKAVRLLDCAYEAGINHYDVGSNIYYRGAERHLAPFVKKHRDSIILISKAPLPIRLAPEEEVSAKRAKRAATAWLRRMDDSLRTLKADYVDAYYLMGVDSPSLIKSEEVYNAFLKAKQAGKVRYFGISTHKNAQACLEAATETGWYDLAMIGITPSGWYDWDSKELVADSPSLVELRPVLDRAKKAGVGLVGMKAVRYLAGMWQGGQGDQTAFDLDYEDKLLESPLSPFQKSYAYVLEHGMDVVNADMQNYTHLEANLTAVKTGHQYFV